MILKSIPYEFSTYYLSRVCGDDPEEGRVLPTIDKFVPRMRG